ncbi:MAG: diaminopropionate ammonia-lyase [Desulfobacterales bacterium]
MTDSPSIKAVFPKKTAPDYPDALKPENVRAVLRFHRSVPGYRATPLHCLPELAARLGLRNIYVKDESPRFGLKAFKALGATWALARILCEKLGLEPSDVDFLDLKQAAVRLEDMVFVTATDGNHGRGLAWAASLLGCRSVVYMPAGSARSRVTAIEQEGATVRVTDRNFDGAVRMAAAAARDNGWHLVQDTAFEGYAKVPAWVVQGYTTMAREVLEQLGEKGLETPTHLFLQAGVGSMAASVLGYYANTLGDACPRTLIVEPHQANCMYESALADDGTPKAVKGDLNTIMAGLACGEPSPFAWKVLRDFAAGFVSCSDDVAVVGMRRLARPLGNDPSIVSGESGAVGIGLICRLAADRTLAGIKERIRLDRDSVLLCFSTEGDTDPDNYRAIVYGRPDGGKRA